MQTEIIYHIDEPVDRRTLDKLVKSSKPNTIKKVSPKRQPYEKKHVKKPLFKQLEGPNKEQPKETKQEQDKQPKSQHKKVTKTISQTSQQTSEQPEQPEPEEKVFVKKEMKQFYLEEFMKLWSENKMNEKYPEIDNSLEKLPEEFFEEKFSIQSWVDLKKVNSVLTLGHVMSAIASKLGFKLSKMYVRVEGQLSGIQVDGKLHPVNAKSMEHTSHLKSLLNEFNGHAREFYNLQNQRKNRNEQRNDHRNDHRNEHRNEKKTK